jgi:hypothetical protein
MTTDTLLAAQVVAETHTLSEIASHCRLRAGVEISGLGGKVVVIRRARASKSGEDRYRQGVIAYCVGQRILFRRYDPLASE